MGTYHKVLSKQLAAADDNGIAETQSPAAAGNLTLDGDLVNSSGVAVLDTPRRVAITSDDDDTGVIFTVYGTNYSGDNISESLAGPDSAAVYTVNDFATVTRISISAASTGAIIAGTNAVGSTAPMIVDRFINPANISAIVNVSGTVTYTVQVSYDDYAPAWDIYTVPPTWVAPLSSTDFDAETTQKSGIINGPITMIRLLVTSGTGEAALTVNVPMIFGR